MTEIKEEKKWLERKKGVRGRAAFKKMSVQCAFICFVLHSTCYSKVIALEVITQNQKILQNLPQTKQVGVFFSKIIPP
jgi:hypothetical protein